MPPVSQVVGDFGTFSATGAVAGITLNAGEVVVLVARNNLSGANSIINLTRRSNAGASTFTLKAGAVYPIPGDLFSAISLGAGPTCDWFRIRNADSPGFVSGVSQSLAISNSVVVDAQQFAPTSVANGTVETAEANGAVNIPALGARLYYALSVDSAIVTAADVLVYTAIKGHTSATYYFVQMGPGSIAMEVNFIPQGGIAEKIDIVARNQDTVAHGMAGSWGASTP